SIMNMAEKGAKGKPEGIENKDISSKITENEASLGRKMSYKERMAEPDKYISDQSTVMDYYDRGKEMVDLKRKYQRDGNEQQIKEYKQIYNPYTDEHEEKNNRKKK